MPSKLTSCLAALGLGAFLIGCSKTTEQQMQKYMEFYYPSSGDYTYEIAFDWGTYVIKTESATGETVHADSKPYRGYITMRPKPKADSKEQGLVVYVINPKGEVWKTQALAEIPPSKQRQEVVVTKTGHGTSTETTTIESVSEPIVDHFKRHANRWQRYGTLEPGNGKKSKLKLVK